MAVAATLIAAQEADGPQRRTGRPVPLLVCCRKCGEFNSVEEAVEAFMRRRLRREEFYRSLNRGVPTELSQMPSYVRAVQRHWGLTHRNSARRLLAEIEGFKSWVDMMSAD